MADKMGPALGQAVIVENVGGAGGSIRCGTRGALLCPSGYTIDIGQWDTRVGSIIYNLNYDLQKDFAPIGLISNNPQLLVATQGDAGGRSERTLVGWMKAHPGDGQIRQPERRRPGQSKLLQQLTGTKVFVYSLPRRRAGDDRPDFGPGRFVGRSRAQ